jgi:hypothetical protein
VSLRRRGGGGRGDDIIADIIMLLPSNVPSSSLLCPRGDNDVSSFVKFMEERYH